MNRRGFLVGAIIAPLGAMVPIGYVWKAQTRPKSFLYVVPTPRQAEALYNKMGRPSNVKVISAGSMICGYGADLIIMDENWRKSPYSEHNHSVVRKELIERWFNDTVRTRLYRNGRIITRRLV